jgi:hypothetical protein
LRWARILLGPGTTKSAETQGPNEMALFKERAHLTDMRDAASKTL